MKRSLHQIWKSEFIDHFSHLPEDVSATLVELQMNAKIQSYEKNWPNLQQYLIKNNNTFLGLVLTDQSESTLHIIDLIVTKQYRNKGIATSVLKALHQQATNSNITSLKLSVAKENPAIKLYLKLGFKTSAKSDSFFQMEYATLSKS